jgi:hypothetical protein
MSIPISQTPVRPSVRVPFRVLAALLCIAAVIAIVGTLFMMWRGARLLTVGDVVALPGMVWLLRLAFHAAMNGKTPRGSDWWPFASHGVFNCYMFIMFAYVIFRG